MPTRRTPARLASIEAKRRRTNNSLSTAQDGEGIWDFEDISPARTRRSRTMIEADEVGKKAQGKRRNSETGTRDIRRNSVCGIEGRRRQGLNIEESPILHRARKRSSRYIQDSDTEEAIDSVDTCEEAAQDDLTETQQTEIIVVEEEPRYTITLDSSPTKRLPNVIVEIPLRPRRNSRRTTLEEIPLENTTIDTPEPSPQKKSIVIPSPQCIQSPQPIPLDEEPQLSQGLENIVLAAIPTTPLTIQLEDVIAAPAVGQGTLMSPVKSTGIAKILAKSPNRPMYRVGLSRRVNVEPLHGYLKRSAS